MRRALRMTRQAISPRLAIRIFVNITCSLSRIAGEGAERSEAGEGACRGADPHPPAPLAWAPPSPALRERGLERDVVVLLPRVLKLFAAQHGEGASEAPPRRPRQDHVVDEAAARRDERVGEFLAIFLRARFDRRGVTEIGAE